MLKYIGIRKHLKYNIWLCTESSFFFNIIGNKDYLSLTKRSNMCALIRGKRYALASIIYEEY